MKKKFWCPRALQWVQERTAAAPPSTTDHQASMGFESCCTVQVGLDYWWVGSQSNEKLNPGCPPRFCFWLAAVSRLLFVLVSGQMEKHWTAHFFQSRDRFGLQMMGGHWSKGASGDTRLTDGAVVKYHNNYLHECISTAARLPQLQCRHFRGETLWYYLDEMLHFYWGSAFFSHSNTVQDSWKQDSSYFEPTT